MSVREHSLGPLYLARVRLTKKWCPLHVVEVTEVNPPWRRGKAVVISCIPYQAAVVGLWRRKVNSDDHIVEDEAAPAWAGVLHATPAEIADWDDGSAP